VGFPVNDWQQYLLLVKYHRRMSHTRLRHLFSQSKLMALTLSVFLLGYAVTGYFLFRQGIYFIERIPGVGTFLGDRMIYILFFFFFLMLVFSVGITNFIGLIKGKEIGWLLTLPLSYRVVFLWKSTEAMLVSSWGLLFISAPLLLAFAGTREASWTFYPKSLLILIPFVMVAATAGSTFFLVILRWVSRRVAIVLTVLAVIGAVYYGITAYQQTVKYGPHGGGVIEIGQILKHTDICIHPLLPSTWLSHVLIQWTQPEQHTVGFFTFVLWSWALGSVCLMAALGRHWFYPGWIQNLDRGAASASRRRDSRAGHAYGWVRGIPKVFGMGRPVRAVIRKDMLTFVREPSQWVQFAIVFGLLLLYVLNLRNLGYDLESPFWTAVVSFLNLTVCALAVSTLTTRFVFPQFSLEGSRLWILGMSPLSLDRVVLQKWIQALLFTGVLTTGLQLVSGWMLRLDQVDVLYFTFAVLLISMGLCGIAVGLGSIFPNLKEVNAAKIVSGFGGTLCLIWSFLYIAAMITMLALGKVPIFREARDIPTPPGPWRMWAMIGAVAITLLLGIIPLLIAMRKARRMELTSSVM